MGDKLRLVVMAHRRIRITGQIADTEEAPAGNCRLKDLLIVL